MREVNMMTLDAIFQDGYAIDVALKQMSERDRARVEGVILGLCMARSSDSIQPTKPSSA